MLKRIFVAGTDTAVGKTIVSRALLQNLAARKLSAVGYKPIARGSQVTPEGLRNKDALILNASSTMTLPYAQTNPICFQEEEISAYTGDDINYSLMSSGLSHLSEMADVVVVEGSGGWRTIMTDYRPYSDWVIQEQLPVILVIGIKLGCISHALLTAQAIISDGLPLIGWVTNRINPGLAHYAEIIDILRNKIPAPQLGELPYLPRAEQRDLAGYIELGSLLDKKQRLTA
ncbi:dethiobiotin synthase [Martelella alba]|uniref:ATP-dependent dethiobiotin synthetase BioD n=1 Tax=Martelella alba TaxID=2590451 RepID=A0ABY2SMQ2_9HYPH|nr:dethiobiotin synthase [Martelella alba]TKI05679.1 ATP-dependent dethiobiotin synthetase BioD [Martelella alba]